MKVQNSVVMLPGGSLTGTYNPRLKGDKLLTRQATIQWGTGELWIRIEL
ncbi:MAG TPA: hypothetical protein VI385_01425 [Flavisolibacter sp.]